MFLFFSKCCKKILLPIRIEWQPDQIENKSKRKHASAHQIQPRINRRMQPFESQFAYSMARESANNQY